MCHLTVSDEVKYMYVISVSLEKFVDFYLSLFTLYLLFNKKGFNAQFTQTRPAGHCKSRVEKNMYGLL